MGFVKPGLLRGRGQSPLREGAIGRVFGWVPAWARTEPAVPAAESSRHPARDALVAVPRCAGGHRSRGRTAVSRRVGRPFPSSPSSTRRPCRPQARPRGRRRRFPRPPPRGPAAVCPYCRPIRAETQHAHPLRMGWACVSAEPKALAAGPAGPKALAVGPAGPAFRFPSSPEKRRRRQAPARGPAAGCPCYRPIRDETQHAHPLRMGWACVYAEPKATGGRPCRPGPA